MNSSLYKTFNKHLITEKAVPSIGELFDMPESMSSRKRQDLFEFGHKILAQKGLGPDDELSLEESYDCLSQAGFGYLFPRILMAYLEGTFKQNGNFSSMLFDTCIKNTSFLSRKHGRGKFMDRLEGYMRTLTHSQKEVLSNVLEHLELR